MNFAAPGLLLIFLLMPGVVCRGAYLRGQWDDHPFRSPITDEIVYGLAVAVPLHALWVWVARTVGRPVSLVDVTALAFGPASGNDGFKGAVVHFSRDMPWVALYIGTLFAAAWLLGHLAHWCVVQGRLDVQTRGFRFPHPWYYLLTGRIMDFGKAHGPFESDRIKAKMVAALVVQGSDAVVYRGALDKYHFDAAGNLDRILILSPQRAMLKDVRDAEQSGRDPNAAFQSIPGRYMAIYSREIKNLQVDYLLEPRDAS